MSVSNQHPQYQTIVICCCLELVKISIMNLDTWFVFLPPGGVPDLREPQKQHKDCRERMCGGQSAGAWQPTARVHCYTQRELWLH